MGVAFKTLISFYFHKRIRIWYLNDCMLFEYFELFL